MGWSPSNTLLGTVNEQENIDFNILTYGIHPIDETSGIIVSIEKS